jgi:hypothetical protein
MKTVFNKVLLLLVVSLFIITSLGCEAEREIVNESPNRDVNIKRVTNKEIQKNPRLMQVMNRFKAFQSDQSISRIVYDSISGLYFDDEKGLYISNESKHSYTFPIIKLDPNQKVENICFNLNENGDYDVYLVKYDFTKTEYQNLTEEQLRLSESSFVPLLKDGNVVQTLVYACVDTYGWVVTEPVPLDQGDLTGNFGYQGGTTAWVIIATNCFFVNSDYNDPEAPSGGTSGTFNSSDVGGNNSGTGILTGGLIDDTEVVQSDLPIVYLLGLYTQTLNDTQEQVYNSHPIMKDYLLLANCSQSSMNFITQLIDDIIQAPNQVSVLSRLELLNTIVENDLEVDFDYEGENYQTFNSVDELENYIESVYIDYDDNTVGQGTILDQNQLFGTKTIQLSSIISLTIEVVADTQPVLSLNADGCKSYISNVVIGNDWVQNSMSITNINYSDTHAQITLSGYVNIGVNLPDIGMQFGIKQRRIITFLIDKSTGELCCSRVTKL